MSGFEAGLRAMRALVEEFDGDPTIDWRANAEDYASQNAALRDLLQEARADRDQWRDRALAAEAKANAAIDDGNDTAGDNAELRRRITDQEAATNEAMQQRSILEGALGQIRAALQRAQAQVEMALDPDGEQGRDDPAGGGF